MFRSFMVRKDLDVKRNDSGIGDDGDQEAVQYRDGVGSQRGEQTFSVASAHGVFGVCF